MPCTRQSFKKVTVSFIVNSCEIPVASNALPLPMRLTISGRQVLNYNPSRYPPPCRRDRQKNWITKLVRATFYHSDLAQLAKNGLVNWDQKWLPLTIALPVSPPPPIKLRVV